jgi:pyridoxal phosphate enzyme (YggS family)
MSIIRENLLRVTERIEKAAQNAGRNLKDIRLVAVSKTVETDRVREAIEAGVTILGENYVQEAQKKIEEIGKPVSCHWLRRITKVASASSCNSFHGQHCASEELNRRLSGESKMPVMIEVNLSGETTKFGTEEEKVTALAQGVLKLDHLSLEGLMTMPPYFDDPEMSRPYFVQLRELKERLVKGGIPLKDLSMGMSNDFEIAIQEGATFVRVGTAIFGARR